MTDPAVFIEPPPPQPVTVISPQAAPPVVFVATAPTVPLPVINPPAPQAVVFVEPPGPQGPQGVGGGSSGQPRFTGHGAPPDFIYGAQIGDQYLDLDTGLIWGLL